MGFLDRMSEGFFRDAHGARVLVAYYQGRTRGYKLGSAGDEARIRAYLRLLLFAQFAIQVLGTCTAFSAVQFTRQWNAATRASDLVLLLVSFLAAYAVFAVLPVLLLRRLYARALPSLVSLSDEVPVAPLPRTRTVLALALAVVVALGLLLILLLRFAAQQR
jgi:hypothetical protein